MSERATRLSVSNSAASASSLSTERAASVSMQPCWANRRAQASPMPELAPVMMTTFPESEMLMSTPWHTLDMQSTGIEFQTRSICGSMTRSRTVTRRGRVNMKSIASAQSSDVR